MSQRADRHFSYARGRRSHWPAVAGLAVVAVLASALPSVAPVPAGADTVSVTATDKGGATGPAATPTITVVAVADAGGPYAIDEGDALTLDATGSAASAAAVFTWDLDGDGQFDDADGASPTIPNITVQQLGLGDGPATRTVTVQLSDGPSVVTDTAIVTVSNVAPGGGPNSLPSPIIVGRPMTFTFGAFDPSDADNAAGFTYVVDFGDGSPVVSQAGGIDTAITHTYATVGTFTITVTMTDKDNGTSGLAMATAVVVPLVAADAGGPYAINEGDLLSLDATRTTTGPTAVYEWDLDGDGQFDDATGAALVLFRDELARVGLDDGPATATFTLRVTEGTTVNTDTADYSIANVAPRATVALLGPVVAGTPSTVKVGALDRSLTDMANDFEYRIDWEGDGTIDDVVTGPADPPVTHTYASVGAVGLTVIAVDKDGAASTPTVSMVTVTPAQPAMTTTTTGTGGTSGTTTGGTSATGLPRTGFNSAPLALAALTLVLAGAALVAVGVARQSWPGAAGRSSRRRRRTAPTRNTGSPTA